MRVISSSLSPNTESDDVLAALKIIIKPHMWKEGPSLQNVTEWFAIFFEHEYHPVFFNSGRSALFAILHAFAIGRGDEVLLQAFTCVAVPNSIRWAGAKPVYVDIDTTYNIDPEDIKRKITARTKAIIVQHTFGIPAQMDEILKIAQQHKLVVIEDCAHSIGARYKGRKIGSLGDAAFFSFGRDKVVSSVWGGGAFIQGKWSKERARLHAIHASLSYPSNFWIFQQVLHPIAFSLILPMYRIGLGKVLLRILQLVHLLSFPVSVEEKKGNMPNNFILKYPNALAGLVIYQLEKLDRYNMTRQKTAEYYRKNLSGKTSMVLAPDIQGATYVRFPLLVRGPTDCIEKAKANGIQLGNWFHALIDPGGVNLRSAGYNAGSCPQAETYAREIINLPTRVTQEQASRIVRILLSSDTI